MTLKVIGGSLLSVVGTLVSFLGILFFVASRGTGIRLVVGIVLCLAGFCTAALGAVLFLRGIARGPAAIRRRILWLAQRHQGALDADRITAELGESGDVRMQIAALLADGSAREEREAGRVRYCFPAFMLNKAVSRCPYCGTEFPVRDIVERCPRCGGDIKTERTLIAGAGDRYAMDDDDPRGRA